MKAFALSSFPIFRSPLHLRLIPVQLHRTMIAITIYLFHLSKNSNKWQEEDEEKNSDDNNS